MSTESRAHAVLRNSAWSIAGYIVPIFIAVFVTPIIVFSLGEHDYGVYTFLISVIGILGIVDLGVSTAVSRKITEHHSRNERQALRESLKTVNSLAFLIGATGLLVCVALGAGGHALISGSLTPHVFWLYFLVGLTFFVNSAGMVWTIAPNALQRFDVSTKIATGLAIATAGASIAAVKLGYGVMGLVIIQLALSLSIAVISGIRSRKLLPDTLTLSFGWSRDEVKSLYSSGFRIFFANIGGTSSAYLSRLIIPVFLGPSALTYYSLPGSVAQRIPGVTGTLSGVLFPLTASLSSVGETERIKVLYIRSFRLITILASAAASTLVFFAEPVLRYWLNEEFAARSTNVLIILAVTNFVLAIYGPLYNFVLGLGRLRMITVVSFVTGALNALLLWILMPLLDIEGAAWAYLLSVLPIAYMIYHTEIKYLKIELRTHYYLKLALKTMVTVVASYVVARLVWLPLTTSLVTLCFTGSASVLTYLALYRVFGFYEEEDKRDLTSFARSLVKKII